MPNGKLDAGNLKLLGVCKGNNSYQNEEETHKRATVDEKADASATIGGHRLGEVIVGLPPELKQFPRKHPWRRRWLLQLAPPWAPEPIIGTELSCGERSSGEGAPRGHREDHREGGHGIFGQKASRHRSDAPKEKKSSFRKTPPRHLILWHQSLKGLFLSS